MMSPTAPDTTSQRHPGGPHVDTHGITAGGNVRKIKSHTRIDQQHPIAESYGTIFGVVLGAPAGQTHAERDREQETQEERLC